MSKTRYQRTALTGGGASALDGIDGAGLNDGDYALMMTSSNLFYVYILDASSGLAESSPQIISPDDNPGNKRWILQYQTGTAAPLVNLLGGASALSVWSNSDTNKGLGTLNYDVGDDGTGDVPDPGDTVVTTRGNGEATGKIISITTATGAWADGDATGVIVLGACTGRFSDNEAIAFTDGETAQVNMPDSAAGVDEVRNGEFQVANAPNNTVDGWTASNATLSTEAGGDVGNCMKVLDGGAGNGYGYQSITTVVGKLYSFSCYAKDIDTGQNGLIEVGTAAGDAIYYSSGAITDDAGDTYTVTFEATTTTTVISLNCTSAAGAYYYDSVSLYEITPCCTGNDVLAMDGWSKTTTLDIYREHWGSNTKDGSFYATKIIKGIGGTENLLRPLNSIKQLESYYSMFQSRTVAMGMWIKTDIASHARAFIYTGSSYTYSRHHTGGNTFEWLEISATIEANATNVFFGTALDADIGDIAYISQPMLAFSSSIGEGNYVLAPGEVVWCEKAIGANDYGLATISANVNVNLEAQTDGKIPKGCKAVHIQIVGVCANKTKWLNIADSISENNFGPRILTSVQNEYHFAQSWAPCSPAGDIAITRDDTFTNVDFTFTAVQVS